jgi:hypothetical protein
MPSAPGVSKKKELSRASPDEMAQTGWLARPSSA